MKQQPVVAVGAVVFKDDAVLLVKRKNEPAAGQWAIPGGKVRYGERLTEAVKREVREETGIDIEVGKLVYVFEYTAGPHYVIIDYAARFCGGQLQAGDDALEAAWINAEDVLKKDITDSTRKLLRSKFNFPA